MTLDGTAGTTPVAGEAQNDGTAAPDSGTQPNQDEVTTLRSRNKGLDAKVTELTKAREAADKAAADAAAKLADYEAGKVGADEALRAQIALKDNELTAARREAALAKLSGQFPETFAVLGEDAINLTADKLAEAEARFKGVAAEVENPVPVGNNPSRTQGGASGAPNKAESSVADALAQLRTMTPPWLARD